VLTSKRERGPSRDWLAVVKTTRARNKIKQWFKQESREDTEHTGRALLQEHLNKAGLPAQKITGSPLLADVIREMGFRKADDFYIALGGRKISPKVIVNKVLQRLKQGEAAEEETTTAESLVSTRRQRRQPTGSSASYGIRSRASTTSCCAWPSAVAPYPAIRSSATSRSGAASPSTATTARTPPRCARTPSASSACTGRATTRPRSRSSCRSTPWDRHRLLEDLSRTFAEAGINIVEARCIVSSPMVQNRFVVEVADTQALKQTSPGCATSTRSSTPTASRRARAEVRRAARRGALADPVPVAGADVRPLVAGAVARVRRRRRRQGDRGGDGGDRQPGEDARCASHRVWVLIRSRKLWM
jgi:GTP pyrophosphokinase